MTTQTDRPSAPASGTRSLYENPTVEDFDRALHILAADKLELMLRARIEVQSDCILNAGGLSHSRYPLTTADRYDHLSRAFIAEAVERAAAYVGKLGTPKEVADWLRPHAERLKDRAMEEIPKEMNMQAQLQAKYRAAFTTRLDAALRDLEIGIVNGRTMAPAAPSTPKSTDIVQLKPGLWGVNIDLLELWRRYRARGRGGKL
jgi:hypothetical protein